MKTIIFTFMLLTAPTMLFSQQVDVICATPDNDAQDLAGVYSYSIAPELLASFEPVVFNIYFWGINKSDGEPGFELLTEEDCLTAVSQLNRVYNSFNVFFKYYGFDNTSFNSDEYYHLTKGEVGIGYNVFDFAVDNGYKKTNSFNAYIASGGADFGGAAESYNLTNIATHQNFAQGTEVVIAHEIGHCLDLVHTHRSWAVNYCEHVTRDITNDDYNANDHGDFIHDTAAMPRFDIEHLMELLWAGVPFEEAIEEYIPYKYVDLVTFEYDNDNGEDCLDIPEPYQISPIDTKNYMSYGPAAPSAFFKLFSNGQKIRMREAIIEDLFGEFEAAKTTIPALYKPYKGEYYNQGPMQAEHYPLFQPGFEYRFVECEGDYPQPSTFENTNYNYDIDTVLLSVNKDETDYSIITHPNHSAVYIVHHDLVESPYPRKCYDNYNRKPIGGTVVKFNDNVFNYNITLTPQDSTAINNESLIQNLENGLYKIEKSYDDGTIEETIIIKDNN